jgi:membrane associated rhomboid family serine protease
MHKHNYINATNALILICVVVFSLLTLVMDVGRSGFELFYWQSPLFNLTQLVSHMFLHGGVMHLAFNMLGLWMFGSAIERVWGAPKFLLYYFICGLGAALIYEGVNYYQFQVAIAPLLDAGINQENIIQLFSQNQYYPQFPTAKQAIIIFSSPVVGASGAIYGVLVAFACLFPNHKMILLFLPFPIAAKYFVPALLCLDLFSGVTGLPIFGNNIAHAAHIGGAITGLLLMMTLMRRNRGMS